MDAIVPRWDYRAHRSTAILMAFRFLHTSDWQIGMHAAHIAGQAAVVRAARLQAARRVIEIGNGAGVDAVILAGDTFEASDVPAGAVQDVVDILRESRAPVFVLPANHDPLVPRGIFEHRAWQDAAPRVSVLREAQVVAVGDADLLACPLRTRTSTQDPTAWISAPAASSRIRVAVAHGSLVGAGAADGDVEDDFPIDRCVVARAQLDYLALGHWHRPSTYDVGGATRVAYCGSHEPTKFGEMSQDGTRRSGEILVVTIDAPGAAPRLERHRTAVLDWRQQAVEVHGVDDLLALRRQLDGEPPASRERSLLELSLTGELPLTARGEVVELETLARKRFLFARIRSELRFTTAGDDWLASVPAGAPARAAKRLAEASAKDDPASESARRALDLLSAIVRGGGR